VTSNEKRSFFEKRPRWLSPFLLALLLGFVLLFQNFILNWRASPMNVAEVKRFLNCSRFFPPWLTEKMESWQNASSPLGIEKLVWKAYIASQTEVTISVTSPHCPKGCFEHFGFEVISEPDLSAHIASLSLNFSVQRFTLRNTHSGYVFSWLFDPKTGFPLAAKIPNETGIWREIYIRYSWFLSHLRSPDSLHAKILIAPSQKNASLSLDLKMASDIVAVLAFSLIQEGAGK
jgi:hypothetical protein